MPFTIAQALHSYWTGHGQFLSSPYTAKIYSRYWLDYFGEHTIGEIASVKTQAGFHAYLSKKGMKPSTINRVLAVGRAAINRAWRNGEIETAPHITILQEGGAPPRGRPLEFDEMARLIDHIESEHVLAFCILMIRTAARPDAVRGLIREHVDFNNDLIHLNPPGRQQTKKYRPTVKLPRSLHGYLHRAPEGQFIAFRGKEVMQVRTAWRSLRRRAELDADVNPYSIRHTMARWMRSQSVPAWEVAAQLGHKQLGMSTTEIYAPFDPSYLVNAVTEIDAYFEQLRANCVLVDDALKR